MTIGRSFQNTLSTVMRPMRRCKKPRLDDSLNDEDEKENKGVYSSFSSDNHLVMRPIFELLWTYQFLAFG